MAVKASNQATLIDVTDGYSVTLTSVIHIHLSEEQVALDQDRHVQQKQ